jgi:hypothetical protein
MQTAHVERRTASDPRVARAGRAFTYGTRGGIIVPGVLMDVHDVESDLEWAASGAMWLTGFADGPPLLAPAPFASHARAALTLCARRHGKQASTTGS